MAFEGLEIEWAMKEAESNGLPDDVNPGSWCMAALLAQEEHKIRAERVLEQLGLSLEHYFRRFAFAAEETEVPETEVPES